MPVQHSPVKDSSTLDISKTDCWCGHNDHKCMVECYVCGHYIHYECMGLSPLQISQVINLEDSGIYFCKACLIDYPDSTSQSNICKEITNPSIFCFQNGSITSNPQNQHSLPAPDVSTFISPQVIQQIIESATKAACKAAVESVMELVDEIVERKDKKHNLVAVGFPEDENDIISQNTTDTSLVHSYCKSLNLDPNCVEKTFRDGKRGKNGRIIKICFRRGCSYERMEFLRRVKRECIEKDSNFKNAVFKPFVRTDMTFKQRKADEILRKELSERRKNGETNLIIRNGAITTRYTSNPEN